MHAHEMAAAHPRATANLNDLLIACVEECYACAQASTSCADACAGSQSVADLVQCIRLCHDNADVCLAAGALATRRTGSNTPTLRLMLQTCAMACRACGEECHRHSADHDHCRLCAEVALRCAWACDQALRTLA